MTVRSKAVHNRVMRYPSTLPGLQANTWIFGRHVFVCLLFFLPPSYHGSSIPGPSPKSHAILLWVAVEGADLIIIITVNNVVLKTKDGRIIHFPPSPNRNPDIWSQYLSGEFDSDWVGKHFYDGSMPAAGALPGTGKRRPGQCQVNGIFNIFFCGRIFEYEKSYSSSCQQCGYSSIRLLVAVLVRSYMQCIAHSNNHSIKGNITTIHFTYPCDIKASSNKFLVGHCFAACGRPGNWM